MFASWIGNLLSTLGNVISSGFNALIDFLAYPFAYLYAFLSGIFYLFEKIYELLVVGISLPVALFQLLFSLSAGMFRTVQSFLTWNGSVAYVNFPSSSIEGFNAVIDALEPTLLLDIIPLGFLAVFWFLTAYTVVGMVGAKK